MRNESCVSQLAQAQETHFHFFRYATDWKPFSLYFATVICFCTWQIHPAHSINFSPLFNDTWRRYHSLTVLFPLFCCCLVGICWSYICCWASHVFVFDLPLGEVLCAIGKRDIQEMPSRCFSKGIIFSQMPKKGKEINQSLWELDMEKKRKKQGRKPACFFFSNVCFFVY